MVVFVVVVGFRSRSGRFMVVFVDRGLGEVVD